MCMLYSSAERPRAAKPKKTPIPLYASFASCNENTKHFLSVPTSSGQLTITRTTSTAQLSRNRRNNTREPGIPLHVHVVTRHDAPFAGTLTNRPPTTTVAPPPHKP